MMHQSEFDAANVALSRAADKRKSLINIHKNWYNATLTTSHYRDPLPNVVCYMVGYTAILHHVTII